MSNSVWVELMDGINLKKCAFREFILPKHSCIFLVYLSNHFKGEFSLNTQQRSMQTEFKKVHITFIKSNKL